MEKYINFLKRNNYSINTIKTYRSILNLYKNEIDDIRNIKNKIKTYFDSPNTAWTHYNVLCSYFMFANDKRLKSLRELKLPRIPKKYMEVFTKKFLMEKTQIYENDSNEKINKKTLIRFLFETGIRSCEINTISNINKNTLIVTGKGNKKREIFHNHLTTKSLELKNVTTKTIRLWVKEILGNKFTPHSIRRSHATYILLSGASPKMVMMQLGHEKIETTFRYMHLSMEENKKIYKRFF